MIFLRKSKFVFLCVTCSRNKGHSDNREDDIRRVIGEMRDFFVELSVVFKILSLRLGSLD